MDSKTRHRASGPATLSRRPFHARDPRLHGCPCCAPILADIARLSLPYMAAASGEGAWKRLGPAPGAPVGTRVLVNARILTVDAAFSAAEALAHRDGRIIAVGTRADVMAEAGEDAQIVDCGGRTVLPGFIEPHMHFFSIAILGRYPDVGPMACADADAVIDRIGALSAAAPAGDWIVARQFDTA